MDNTPIPKVARVSQRPLAYIRGFNLEQAPQIYYPSCLQNLRTHMPHLCLQPITIYTSQAIHITGSQACIHYARIIF